MGAGLRYLISIPSFCLVLFAVEPLKGQELVDDPQSNEFSELVPTLEPALTLEPAFIDWPLSSAEVLQGAALEGPALPADSISNEDKTRDLIGAAIGGTVVGLLARTVICAGAESDPCENGFLYFLGGFAVGAIIGAGIASGL